MPRLRRYLWRHLHDASQRDLAEGGMFLPMILGKCSDPLQTENHALLPPNMGCCRVFGGCRCSLHNKVRPGSTGMCIMCVVPGFIGPVMLILAAIGKSSLRPLCFSKSQDEVRRTWILKLLKLHSTKRQRPEVPTKISGQEHLRNLQRKCRTLNVLSHYDPSRQTERSCHDGNGW